MRITAEPSVFGNNGSMDDVGLGGKLVCGLLWFHFFFKNVI